MVDKLVVNLHIIMFVVETSSALRCGWVVPLNIQREIIKGQESFKKNGWRKTQKWEEHIERMGKKILIRDTDVRGVEGERKQTDDPDCAVRLARG